MRIQSRIPFEVEVSEGEKLKLSAKRLTYEETSRLRALWKQAENAAEEQSDESWGALLVEAFQFVRIESELIYEGEDGDRKLKKGEELLAVFGGARIILVRILTGLLQKNTLSNLEKNGSPSRIDSGHSSDELAREAHGPKPETTVLSAENVDSARNEDARGHQDITQSGSMDEARMESQPSSSTNAPSAY